MLEDEMAKLDWPTTPLKDKIKAMIAEIDTELQASPVDIVDMVLTHLANRDPCGLSKLLAKQRDILRLMCGKDLPSIFGQHEAPVASQWHTSSATDDVASVRTSGAAASNR